MELCVFTVFSVAMNWPRAHWLTGTLTLILFPLAGVYMRYVADVPSLDDAPRLVFRSRFLFLLLIALANLGLSYAQPTRLTERLASGIVLVAPLSLIASFFIDPGQGVHSSALTVLTMRGLFVAAILLAFAHRSKLYGGN
jgi:hypothetical protein